MKSQRVLACVLLGGLVTACGEAGDDQPPDPSPVVAEEQAESISWDSVPMPDYPEPQRGSLVATGAGPYMLDGAWEAVALTCEDPPMMQVLAQQPGIGVLVLLQMPEPGDRITDYPVMIVERGAPVPPASQIAVQLFQGGAASAFQAAEGQVSVYGMDERISGRFAVVLREITSNDLQKYAGVFHGVPITAIPEADCMRVKESLQVTPDSAQADSTPNTER